MNAPLPQLAGWLDRAAPDSISGWAVFVGWPDVAVTLAFYINGQKVAVATCDKPRPDAAAAGFAGARAFAVNPQSWLKDGANALEVRAEASGAMLPNGQQSISVGGSNEIGDYWSAQYSKQRTLTTRWWESDYIVKRINRKVCGESLPGMSSGLHRVAAERFADRLPFARGVSIGCGTGSKERNVIRSGLVQHFTLFELSSVAVEQGRAQAAREGLEANMTFRMEDGMAAETGEGVYDVVYWNNALHHMFDVKAALEWSRRVLRKGGVMLMDDFVGPTRMQWSDQLLEINNAVRRAIPPQYLRYPGRPDLMLQPRVERTPVAAIMAMDPSECADSVNILPELTRVFPDAWVHKTGGGIYHLALNDILHNIIAAQDYDLLERLLEVDDECAKIGETHYAVAIAVK
ncbi:class I SAM-dependent methyltransferase [Trinickia dinghuensis]|uniref:Class I SAM-dependent methyltransferase n=1 Tax=Trinickia dinghuensis TaxID=2291023 RepID=A0A3D8K0H4_9BURK|nr:class I SAM-dependent methyltransferase [Trinickia dinghuensis]RDU98394.1 class I SAM-dependent methyltransferase [Trinickia dinghuensis]